MAIARIGKDYFKTEIISNGHSVIADEPTDVGGTDQGSSPSEFLLVALASCTAITLRMYADRKKWALDKIEVEVNLEKGANTILFTREVLLEGTLDNEQRERLLQIANACPVHKILSNPIQISTKLIDAPFSG